MKPADAVASSHTWREQNRRFCQIMSTLEERSRGGYYIILYWGQQDCQTAYINGKTPIACLGAGPRPACLSAVGNCKPPGTKGTLGAVTHHKLWPAQGRLAPPHPWAVLTHCRCAHSGLSLQEQVLAEQCVQYLQHHLRELVNSPSLQEWDLFPQLSLEAEVKVKLHSYMRFKFAFST